MDEVARAAPPVASIVAPAALSGLPGWLCWRYEQAKKAKPGAKPLKVPYYLSGSKRWGGQGSDTDRAKLVVFPAAQKGACHQDMTGIGLAMLEDWGICALDFDHCVGPGGKLPPEVAQIAARTYCEYSPSGTGVRAFVRGNYGNRKFRAKDGSFGFETFSTNGFVTFTGNVVYETKVLDVDGVIADLDDLVRPLCEKYFGTRTPEAPPAFDPDDPNSIGDPFVHLKPKLQMSLADIEDHVGRLDPAMPYWDWIRVGMGVHHETDGSEDGFYIWDNWSALSDEDYPGEEKLRTFWNGFERRKGDRRPLVTMRTVKMMVNGATDGIDTSALMASSKVAIAAADLSTSSTPEDYAGKFKIESTLSLKKLARLTWWIKGILPKAQLGMLYGASGSGKTFVALDLAFAIVLGRPWQGHRVQQGRVLYVAAEGGVGIRSRIEAYCLHHGIDMAALNQLGILRVPPNILDSDDTRELIDAIAKAGGFDVIVIDTYAQVTPGGNENTSEDMGRALTHCRVITEVTGAMVVLIHHAGKDASKGARGWSGIRAAVDVEFEIIKHDTGERTLTLSKLKDGEDGLQWGVKLHQLKLDTDEDGDPVTSCVALIGDPPTIAPVEKPRRDMVRYDKFERHVLEVMRADYAGKKDEAHAAFIAKCAETWPEEGGRGNHDVMLKQAVHKLAKRQNGKLALENGRVLFLEDGA